MKFIIENKLPLKALSLALKFYHKILNDKKYSSGSRKLNLYVTWHNN